MASILFSCAVHWNVLLFFSQKLLLFGYPYFWFIRALFFRGALRFDDGFVACGLYPRRGLHSDIKEREVRGYLLTLPPTYLSVCLSVFLSVIMRASASISCTCLCQSRHSTPVDSKRGWSNSGTSLCHQMGLRYSNQALLIPNCWRLLLCTLCQ